MGASINEHTTSSLVPHNIHLSRTQRLRSKTAPFVLQDTKVDRHGPSICPEKSYQNDVSLPFTKCNKSFNEEVLSLQEFRRGLEIRSMSQKQASKDYEIKTYFVFISMETNINSNVHLVYTDESDKNDKASTDTTDNVILLPDYSPENTSLIQIPELTEKIKNKIEPTMNTENRAMSDYEKFGLSDKVVPNYELVLVKIYWETKTNSQKGLSIYKEEAFSSNKSVPMIPISRTNLNTNGYFDTANTILLLVYDTQYKEKFKIHLQKSSATMKDYFVDLKPKDNQHLNIEVQTTIMIVKWKKDTTNSTCIQLRTIFMKHKIMSKEHTTKCTNQKTQNDKPMMKQKAQTISDSILEHINNTYSQFYKYIRKKAINFSCILRGVLDFKLAYTMTGEYYNKFLTSSSHMTNISNIIYTTVLV